MLYNMYHDSGESSNDIQRFRALHVEMDGRSPTPTAGPISTSATTSTRLSRGSASRSANPPAVKSSQRLLKLNHERHAEEVAQGLHDKKKPKAKPGKKKAKANTQAGPSLFHEEDDA